MDGAKAAYEDSIRGVNTAEEKISTMKTETIRIKYHDHDLPKLNKVDIGDCIDLYISSFTFINTPEDMRLVGNLNQCSTYIPKGSVIRCWLGVSMQLPEGYEAHVYPRSSTFKKKGLLLSNSVGIIDNSYASDRDVWQAIFYATKDTTMDYGDRLLQFRIIENQPTIIFDEVESLENVEQRGGFGEGTGE